jgi:hypothetical protein
MTLEAKLAATRDASAKRIPPELQVTMHDATERLRASGIVQQVIKPGRMAPAFSLRDQNDQTVTLSALLAKGPVVMSVFRGFW